MLSRFSILYKSNNNTVLFNTLNRNLKVLNADNLSIENLNKIPSINGNLEDFFVNSSKEDDIHLQYLINSMVFQSSRINITLMMTMKCNFRCIYCFESWMPRQELMELDSKEVVEWILWIVKKYHIKQVDICFHGGEPLLEIEKIQFIANSLKDFFIKNRIFYLFTTVTNGYLLSKNNAMRLYDSNVKIAQITLDGVPEIHDKRRPLSNGEGTFDRIFKNIKENKYIKIYVNIVYDTQNYKHVFDLIDLLNENKMQDKISLIILSSTKPIIDSKGHNDDILSQIDDGNVRIKLWKYVTENNFKVPFDITYQLCTMKQKGSFVVTPDKSLYKCISGVGNEVFKIGELNIGTDPFKQQSAFLKNFDEECKGECPYTPICNRFCLYESYVLNTNKVCRKKYWDNYITKYLELYLNSEFKNNFVMNPNASEWEIMYEE